MNLQQESRKFFGKIPKIELTWLVSVQSFGLSPLILMKTHRLLLVASLLPSFAYSATGIFGSYADVFSSTSSGSSNTVYHGSYYAGSNPAFQGANLGTLNRDSDTLTISRSSFVSFKSGGGDVTGGEIQWRVYKTGATAGSFSIQSFGFGANATATDIGGNQFTGFGDQEWRTESDLDLLAAANASTNGNGEYNVEIFFKAYTNEGDRFSNNGGSNFIATFDVIPEPSAAMLGGLGAFALLRRRRA